jgi:hypothetical protein
MAARAYDLRRRIDGMAQRIDALTGLRRLVDNQGSSVLSPTQWRAVEQCLAGAANTHRLALKQLARHYLPVANIAGAARICNEKLGQQELHLAVSFDVFDTFADIITQRLSPRLGPMLADCDALAKDALKRDIPALQIIEDPIVYCDRGFGASTLREGVTLPDGNPNPVPLIQIPYTRLAEPLHLTSVIHEVGHEIAVRLSLIPVFANLARRVCQGLGIPSRIGESYAYWMSELVPDFIGFCASGLAQPASIREILALPPADVFRFDSLDPHPPPYLRVLMSFAWSRITWGRGLWDGWEEMWQDFYPVECLAPDKAEVFRQFQKVIQPLAECMMTVRLQAVGGIRISELYSTIDAHPASFNLAGSADGRGANIPIRSCRTLHQLRSALEYQANHTSAEKQTLAKLA